MAPETVSRLESAIRSVQAGNRNCFRELAEIMLPILRNYVAARSLPGMDVDDIVQRTFVEAYKGIGEYRLGTDFRSWLVTIARYQTIM
mgnify:CR=1 FL=1